MPAPDLQLSSPQDHNRLIPKLVLAALVMAAIGAAVYFLNPRRAAAVKVQNVAVFAPHTVSNAVAGDGHVMGTPPESEDDVYVVATLALTDKLSLPLYFDSTSATMTTSDGRTLAATVISPTDIPRLEETFPQITPLMSSPATAPFRFEDSIAPGAARVGTVVLLFPQINEQLWRSKQSATLTIRMAHDAATLTVPLR
ncbi:MAG: hypothetical protein WB439_15975 [Acidobacteriaceae bacterium]